MSLKVTQKAFLSYVKYLEEALTRMGGVNCTFTSAFHHSAVVLIQKHWQTTSSDSLHCPDYVLESGLFL